MAGDPLVDIVLITVGVIAIVVALIWRAGSRHREIGRLTRFLGSSDPQRRADAAVALTELGLDRVAVPLLAHARAETDPAVRIAIASAVARRQWEPTGPPSVVPLRRWAADELAEQGYNVTTFGAATTRLADMGGPRLPQPAQTAATPATGADPVAVPDEAGTSFGGV